MRSFLAFIGRQPERKAEAKRARNVVFRLVLLGVVAEPGWNEKRVMMVSVQSKKR